VVGVVGQRTLFGGEVEPAIGPVRFSVSVYGRRRPWSPLLPLVVAQARAAALAGYRAMILGTDGCAVEVRRGVDGFLVTPDHPGVGWSDQTRRLLDEHG
jgi:hypothetical protein